MPQSYTNFALYPNGRLNKEREIVGFHPTFDFVFLLLAQESPSKLGSPFARSSQERSDEIQQSFLPSVSISVL